MPAVRGKAGQVGKFGGASKFSKLGLKKTSGGTFSTEALLSKNLHVFNDLAQSKTGVTVVKPATGVKGILGKNSQVYPTPVKGKLGMYIKSGDPTVLVPEIYIPPMGKGTPMTSLRTPAVPSSPKTSPKLLTPEDFVPSRTGGPNDLGPLATAPKVLKSAEKHNSMPVGKPVPADKMIGVDELSLVS